MKKETKELISFICHQLDCERIEALRDGQTAEPYEKAVSFLNSLETFEKQLKLGGFIADKNGHPCKNGDKVKWTGENSDIFAKTGETYILKYYQCCWSVCPIGKNITAWLTPVEIPDQIEFIEAAEEGMEDDQL